MLNHNHSCPSHTPKTVSFWEAITSFFLSVDSNNQYDYLDNSLINQRKSSVEYLRMKKKISYIGCFESMENAKQTCLSNTVK